jgi:hypothetical protein
MQVPEEWFEARGLSILLPFSKAFLSKIYSGLGILKRIRAVSSQNL